MTLILALFSLMIACEQEPVAPPVAPRPPAPKPDYIVSLDEPGEVDTWKKNTIELATSLSNPPDPKVLDGYEASFRVTDASVRTFLEDPSQLSGWPEDFKLDARDRIYGSPAADPEPFVGNAATASELETTGEHFEAGLHYAALSDKVGVERCIKALERKVEWNAIAILAYKIGDDDKLYLAMDKLRELSLYDRMESVIGRAIQDKQIPRATEIATHYGWKLESGKWDRQLEAAGDVAVKTRLVARRITHWIEVAQKSCQGDMEIKACEGQAYTLRAASCDGPDETVPDLAGIVKLASIDRAAAMKLAREFLESRYANVVAVADWCGEGGEGSMVAGTLEFYTLVRGEPDLKAKYLGKTRSWATGAIVLQKREETREEYWDWKGENYTKLPSYQFYVAVKALGDQDLIAAWSDNLALIARLPVTEYENQNVVALDRSLLGVPGGDVKAVSAFRYGEINQQDLVRIWNELKLPTPPAGSTMTLAQIEQAMATAEELERTGYQKEALSALLLPLPLEMQNLSTQDAKVQLRAYAGYLSLQQGNPETARRYIEAEILVRRAEIAHFNAQSEQELKDALTHPYQVAAQNLEIMKRRGDDSASARKPTAIEDAHAMLRPVMDEIEKMPTIHDRALIWIALQGDRSFLDLEVAKRTDEGKLAEVQELVGSLPVNLTQPR